MEREVLLPKLNNPRLRDVGRKQNITRKRLTITNDRLRKTGLRLDCNLQRQAEIEDYLFWQQTMTYKKSLVEHKGLQICLRRKREKSKSLPALPTFQNGVYNGLKIEALKSDVKNVIWEHHPRTRRLRAVENIKSLWKLNGNLVDYNKSLQSLDAIMKRQKDVLPPIRVIRKDISISPENGQEVQIQPLKNGRSLILRPIITNRSFVK